jgi:hypothetical protein
MNTRRILALGVAAVALVSGSPGADSPKELALELARKAKKARKAGHNAEAYMYFAEALALQPSNRSYQGQMESLQTRASLESRPILPKAEEPDAADIPAPEIPMEQAFDSLTAREMAQARDLKEVPALRAKPGVQEFDLTGEPRVLFEKVAQAFGLQTAFDTDYPKTGTPLRFKVSGVDYREAIHDLEAATSSFVVPISGRLMLVAADIASKRNDLEQTVTIAIPVPQAITTQELTELAQILRQATNVEKIAWESTESQIVLRDRVSRVMPAIALMHQLLAYRPEVMVDLEFLQVDQSDMVNYGFTVSNNFTAVYLGQILNNAVTVPSGITNLLTFGGGKTLIGISAAQVQAMFNETRSDSNSIYSAQLRSVSGQPATLHVGEKYPIITGGYFGTVPAGTGTVYSPPPSFSFQDLGLEMKITPIVNAGGMTTLTIETTFQVLTGDTVNNIPVIGNRGLKSQVAVRNDEWSLVGTLLNTTKSKSTSGFWGLAQIPWLRQLFKQTSTDKEESHVLIGIRPHLLSLPAGETVSKALRVGSETRPYTPL